MNDDFYRGSKNGLFFFFIGAIIVIISAAALKVASFPIRTAGGFSLLGVFLALVFLQNRIKKRAYQILQTGSFMLIAVMLGCVFQSTTIFFCTMALQCAVMLMYMDSGFMRIQSIIMTGIFIAVGLPSFMGSPRAADPFQYIACALTVMGVQWMCRNVAKFVELRDRRNREQERSLDDLLKIVEDKCDEARAATKSKSDFLSNMSHEIRTPLNSVLGMNELILREAEDESIINYASNVETSGKLLLSLINDILDFSKIESGKMEIVPVRYQIASVVNDTVNMLSRRFEEKGLELKINADPEIPSCLFGDEVRIRQILTNIMTNALKYTDSGSVTLTAGFEKQSEDSVLLILSVKDTGRGIKEEDRDKLFCGFTRVDQVKNRNIEGTGLGLSITSRLVSMMNGTIEVESVYGEGSEFIVKLPQKIISAEPSGEFCTRTESAPDRRKYRESFTAPEARILVTDDNRSNLLVAEGLLKPTKIQVDCASSGYECINRLRANKYDVLLLDHMMPEMDGVETLKKIREENLAPGMPVVALTANAVSGARDMYVEYGFEDYLAKPIAGNSLEKMLLKLLPPELVHMSDENAAEETADTKETSDIKPSELIDRSVAMTYCSNSEELYLIILQAYCEEFEERVKKLCDFYEQKDIDNYRIVVHSLKSTSLNIGAKALSEEARTHEFAAKDGNWEVIAEDFDRLMENYRAVNEEAMKIAGELETG
ncbi:ATP-binding protein [Huintestinicola sp.]|uniref:ATP-binding protein n=1 Tax=Huintestinicola sp. TaxID=2981661 RepID=UPI003D7E7DEC